MKEKIPPYRTGTQEIRTSTSISNNRNSLSFYDTIIYAGLASLPQVTSKVTILTAALTLGCYVVKLPSAIIAPTKHTLINFS